LRLVGNSRPSRAIVIAIASEAMPIAIVLDPVTRFAGPLGTKAYIAPIVLAIVLTTAIPSSYLLRAILISSRTSISYASLRRSIRTLSISSRLRNSSKIR
jgi:hypothetical protein